MKPFLFDEPLLPDGFLFPADYVALVKDVLPDIEPWKFLAADIAQSLMYFAEMLGKFPSAPLIPFAYLSDPSGFYNDGWVVTAYFDGTELLAQPRVRIYDASAPHNSPWDNASYATFSDWLDAVKAESAQYKIAKAELDADE